MTGQDERMPPTELRVDVNAVRPPHYAAERPWRAVRDSVANEYELIAEVSRSTDERHLAYLARSVQGDLAPVVILTVLRATSEHDGLPERYALSVHSALDATVPANGLTCRRCGREIPTWDVRCSACGATVAGDGPDTIGVPATTVYDGIRHAAQPRFDILGVIPHGTGAVLYAGRRTDDSAIALLRFFRDTATRESAGVRVTVEPVAYLKRLASVPSPHSGELGPLTAPDQSLLPQSVTPRKICPQCAVEYTGEIRFCPADGAVLRPSDAREDLVGHLLGERYHILGLIGEGGMGRVYLAEHIRIGRRCAIKVLPPELSERPDAVRRFAREARNASRIAHPNVAAVYDFEAGRDGLIYLAMEFVEGEALAAILRREHRLAIPRAIAIAAQVADGMQSAHELGIVHRDLKPENIMIARDRDGRDVVKIVDFGIAKALVAHDDEHVTRTGFVVGTPRYMSPEQLSGESVDARTDIYSLGCVLFEMLTGTGPTGDASKESLIRRRLGEPPPRPSLRRADVPGDLDDLVVRALARDATARVQSARDMRRALDAIVVTSPSVPRRRARWIWPVLVAVASLIVVAIWPRRAAVRPIERPTRPIIAMAPVVAALPEVPRATLEPPAPPPRDALFDADREMRLSRYYAAKEPPDFPQAIRLLRHALGLVDALIARYPRSPPIAERRLTLDSLLTETRHECLALHETSCD